MNKNIKLVFMWLVRGGGQGGCEPRIEVFIVKMKKKLGREGGGVCKSSPDILA